MRSDRWIMKTASLGLPVQLQAPPPLLQRWFCCLLISWWCFSYFTFLLYTVIIQWWVSWRQASASIIQWDHIQSQTPAVPCCYSSGISSAFLSGDHIHPPCSLLSNPSTYSPPDSPLPSPSLLLLSGYDILASGISSTNHKGEDKWCLSLGLWLISLITNTMLCICIYFPTKDTAFVLWLCETTFYYFR